MEPPLKSDPIPRQRFLLCLILFVLTAGVFSTVLQNGFIIYDDPSYVTNNTIVRNGLTWPGVVYAFTSTVESNWHPLTILSHMLDCQLFGLQPWGHHLVDVCLHAANTILVFLVLRRMTGALWRSFFVALFFGLHPLHVESVAWVAERKDVLSSFFALLALLAYAKYVSANRGRDYWLALGWFACGLMSKSMLVTLPCVFLLLDFWPLNRWKSAAIRRLILEKLPFFLLSAAACVIALKTQKPAMVSLSALPVQLRAENSCLSCVRYLGKLFCPVNLCVAYPPPASWPLGPFLLSVALLGMITAAAVIWRRRQPFLFTGWFWFTGMLVPVIGLVQVGDQSMADRYTYLPAVGIFIALVWLAPELTRSFKRQKIVLPAAAAVLAAGCAVLTCRQIHCWRDSETLLRHALAVTQDNTKAHLLLGDEFRAQKRFPEAILEFREGIRLNPDLAFLHRELALDLDAAGEKDEAIHEFAEAFRLAPAASEAENNLGMALSRAGRYNEAAQVFLISLQSNPGVEELHFNLGNALAHTGKLPDAIAQFKAAIALNPADIGAHNNLGAMLFQTRQLDQAAVEFQTVLKLDPQNVEARKNLAVILQMKNHTP